MLDKRLKSQGCHEINWLLSIKCWSFYLADPDLEAEEEEEWKPDKVQKSAKTGLVKKLVKTGSVKKKKKSRYDETAKTKSDVKKLNQCPQCDASYNDPQAFKQHVLGHTVDGAEAKLHFCLQCGKDTYFKVFNKLLFFWPW